jgi:hypothetical protein
MRFYGQVGYVSTGEVRAGVWAEKDPVERPYYGDVLRYTRRWQSTDQLNDNLNISNQISILADPYAYEHFSEIRYVYWKNVKWKVTNIEVNYPRLILTIGEVYTENDQS